MTVIVDPLPTAELIEALAKNVSPVRPVRAPLARVAIWLGVVGAIGLALAMLAEPARVAMRLAASLDIAGSVAGSVLTALCAGAAAFQTSMPDRRQAWALLPLPPLALWLGASGAGCLRAEPVTVAGTHIAGLGEVRSCLLFILGLSIPLSMMAVAMLRRAYPLRPRVTATLAGLAAAAAAASLLTLFHPYDASALDLVAHVVSVALVVVASRALGGRVLRVPA